MAVLVITQQGTCALTIKVMLVLTIKWESLLSIIIALPIANLGVLNVLSYRIVVLVVCTCKLR